MASAVAATLIERSHTLCEEEGMGMRKRVPRTALSGLAAIVALGALALTLAPAASAAPTLMLTQNCESYPPYSNVDIHLEGLPPNEPFEGSLVSTDDAGNVTFTYGPAGFTADASGSFDFTWGGDEPLTYKVTVEWAGGTLEATKRVACTLAAGSPIADAGPDQVVASGASVDLDGTGSTDPDGDPLTFDWTQTDGPPVALTGAGTATPSFTAPTGPATLSFRVEACDDGAPPLCDNDTVTIKVNGAPNAEPPTLTLTPTCDTYQGEPGPHYGVGISVSGLPPGYIFTGSLEMTTLDPAGSHNEVAIAPTEVTADENGQYGVQYVGPLSDFPIAYTLTVGWGGGTATKSLTVDCSKPVTPGNDYAARVIVNRPTPATSGGKHHTRGFTVKVTNRDDGPFDVTADDIAAEVLVNGAANGSVRLVSTRVVKPGRRVKFHYSWRYGGVIAGDDIEYSGCVNAAGDPNAGNDCASYTTTAVANP